MTRVPSGRPAKPRPGGGPPGDGGVRVPRPGSGRIAAPPRRLRPGPGGPAREEPHSILGRTRNFARSGGGRRGDTAPGSSRGIAGSPPREGRSLPSGRGRRRRVGWWGGPVAGRAVAAPPDAGPVVRRFHRLGRTRRVDGGNLGGEDFEARQPVRRRRFGQEYGGCFREQASRVAERSGIHRASVSIGRWRARAAFRRAEACARPAPGGSGERARDRAEGVGNAEARGRRPRGDRYGVPGAEGWSEAFRRLRKPATPPAVPGRAGRGRLPLRQPSAASSATCPARSGYAPQPGPRGRSGRAPRTGPPRTRRKGPPGVPSVAGDRRGPDGGNQGIRRRPRRSKRYSGAPSARSERPPASSKSTASP